MATVTITFTNGKKYVSPFITVGLERQLSRFMRDLSKETMRAAELQEQAQELSESGEETATVAQVKVLMAEYESIMDRVDDAVGTRNQLIVRAFGDQFTLDELENLCPKEEAARVIQALQGTSQQVVEKNG